MAVRSLSYPKAQTPKNASLRTRGSQGAGAQTSRRRLLLPSTHPYTCAMLFFIPIFHGLPTCQPCWQAAPGTCSCLPRPLRMTSTLLTHHHATLPRFYPLAPNPLCLGPLWRGLPNAPRARWTVVQQPLNMTAPPNATINNSLQAVHSTQDHSASLQLPSSQPLLTLPCLIRSAQQACYRHDACRPHLQPGAAGQ